jgi:hypothetical protein
MFIFICKGYTDIEVLCFEQRALYPNVRLLNSQQRRLFVERLADSEAHREATASLVRALIMTDIKCHDDDCPSIINFRSDCRCSRRVVSAEQYIDDLCKVLEACRRVTKLCFFEFSMSSIVLPRVVACISELGRLECLTICKTDLEDGNGFRRLLDAAPGLRFLALEKVDFRYPEPPFSTIAASHPYLESVVLSELWGSVYARLLEGVPLRTLTLWNIHDVALVVEAVAPTLEDLGIVWVEDDTLTEADATAVQHCVRLNTLEIFVQGRGEDAEVYDRNLKPTLECLPSSLETLCLTFDYPGLERQVVGWLKNLLKNSEWCPQLRYLGVQVQTRGLEFIVPAGLEKLRRIRAISIIE